MRLKYNVIIKIIKYIIKGRWIMECFKCLSIMKEGYIFIDRKFIMWFFKNEMMLFIIFGRF